jgi:urea transport system substrate-binding protein
MSNSLSQDYATAYPTAASESPPELKPETACPPETRAGSGSPPAEAVAGNMPGMLAHYRILKQLGQGGMGIVYQAEDTRLKRVVALKVMHPELASQPEARERFLREARTMAAVRNDHVVTIFEVSEAGDVPYLAMEFLDGQTLEDWLRNAPPIPLPDILRIGREIATGLAAAQECGLVHRDIKPANLLLVSEVEERGEGGRETRNRVTTHHSPLTTHRIKILDFGLARPMDNRVGLTRTGDVMGTPHYMAPEQALGLPVDGRTDLFSLGVVLYRLCTGQLPFRGSTVTAVVVAVQVNDPQPVREMNPAIPPALADLVMQLLEKEPSRRSASARDVAAVLQTMEGKSSEAPAPAPASGSSRTKGKAATPPRPVRPFIFAGPRRRWLFAGAGLAFLLTAGVVAWSGVNRSTVQADGPSPAPATRPSGPPLRIGVLYSRTGTMAISERSILDGVLLAVDEINEKGGVLGRPVETVIEDGESDESVFARKALKLIKEDGTLAIFGCWTSVSRKAVMAVAEKHDHLLFYPVSYEGMEQSKNVIYGGSVPNQQILPALQWCHGFQNKKRWFLVGLDSVYSRAVQAVIRDEAQRLGTQVVGEEFLPPGSTEVAPVVARIVAARPDLIINTVSGDTNVALFRALRRAGLRGERTPTLSFRLSEDELSGLAPGEVVGHFAAGNYFQSLDLEENQVFLRRVRARFGPDRIVSDPMQTTYALVHLWAHAVRAAGKADVRAIREALPGQRFDAPEGPMTIDPATLHTVQVSRVGRIDRQGRFQEVFLSPQPVPPEPFPASRSREQWEALLKQVRQRWGGRWEFPGTPVGESGR